jgi:enamine deaminase RidA (YjgF/YER057c/UK114 family)
MSVSERLKELGIALPAVPKPVAAYIPARRVGALVVTSGQLPVREGVMMTPGIVGAGVSPEDAKAAARQAALNALAAAADAAGGIDRILSVVRVGVFVASAPDFTGQPAVANGASELMEQVFGENGRHVRASVGSSSLPLNACVEVELMVELG